LSKLPDDLSPGGADQSEDRETPEQQDHSPSGDSSGNAEEKLITQQELERILQRRLKRQEEQFKKQYADYDTFKSEAEEYRKLKSEKATDAERWEQERQKLVADLQEKSERLTKLERANMIAEIASEKGLPKRLWKRIKGDSEEEIAEDIDALLEDLDLAKPKDQGDSKKETPAPKKKGAMYGGGGETEDPDPDTDELVARIPRGPQLRVDKPRTYK